MEINQEDIIYTPKELNNKLLQYTKIIENEYKNIKLKGDVIEYADYGDMVE